MSDQHSLPTVVINEVNVVISENVRIVLGERVMDPVTGMDRPAVFHFAYTMSKDLALKVAHNMTHVLGNHAAKEFAAGQGPNPNQPFLDAIATATPTEVTAEEMAALRQIEP